MIKREEGVYKSPEKKLLGVFRKGRDQWKKKCQLAKGRIKALDNRVRYLEESKNHWKTQAKERENRLKVLEEEMRKLKSAEDSKKK